MIEPQQKTRICGEETCPQHYQQRPDKPEVAICSYSPPKTAKIYGHGPVVCRGESCFWGLEPLIESELQETIRKARALGTI